MKPAPHSRRIAGMPPTRSVGDERDPALLGAQLERLLLDRGWSADVTVGSVMGRWAEIVGPDIAGHVRPVTFEGSVLSVQADSTAWATQIRLLTSSLLGRIEAVVGAGVVTELVVLGPAAPSWVKGRRRVQGPGPRDTYG
jgi:predicted nucleic acid-binding Zn ribbon protein